MNFVIAFLFSMVIIHFCGSDPAIIGAVYNKDNIEKYQIKNAEEYFNGVYPAEEAGIENRGKHG